MTTVQDADEMRKIWTIAKSARVAILTNSDREGRMNARPMLSILSDDDESIWFITDRNSQKLSEGPDESEALLTYSNSTAGDYLVLRGKVCAVEDREKLKSLWNKGDELFFPEGPENSGAVLLRFDPFDAEYWTGGSSAIKFAVQYLKVKLTGNRASIGEHRRVNL